MTRPMLSEIPSLNGLRAVSVAVVFWGHSEIPEVVRGSTGVTVFFFISGYLITTLLMREWDKTGRISIRDFYLRRTLRIFPPLYVVLAAAIIISLTGLLPNQMSPGGVASTVFYYTNYWLIEVGRDTIPAAMNGLWSLAVEEHYYLTFPVLFVALSRRLSTRRQAAAVLAAIALAVMVWRIYLFSQGAGIDRIYLATDTRLDSILWGAVFALLFTPEALQDRLRGRSRPAAVLFVAGVLVFLAASRTPAAIDQTVAYTVQAFALAAIFAAVVGHPDGVPGQVLNWRPVAWVGLVSYSVYLIHRPALELAFEHLPGPKVTDIVVALVATLLLAEVMRRLVEEPCARLRRKLNHTGAPAAHEATPAR